MLFHPYFPWEKLSFFSGLKQSTASNLDPDSLSRAVYFYTPQSCNRFLTQYLPRVLVPSVMLPLNTCFQPSGEAAR